MFFPNVAPVSASAASGNLGILSSWLPFEFFDELLVHPGGDFHARFQPHDVAPRACGTSLSADHSSEAPRRAGRGRMPSEWSNRAGDSARTRRPSGCRAARGRGTGSAGDAPRGGGLTASLAASMNSSMMRWAMLRGVRSMPVMMPCSSNTSSPAQGRSGARQLPRFMRRRCRMSASSLHRLEAPDRGGRSALAPVRRRLRGSGVVGIGRGRSDAARRRGRTPGGRRRPGGRFRAGPTAETGRRRA